MIKFRAWDSKNGFYIYNVQDYYGNINATVLCDDGNNTVYDERCFGDFLNNERYVVEQFTGLKDVNGKEIYVGDIIEATIDGYVQTDKYLVENTWDPHVWEEESDPYYAVSKMKVVGNVHMDGDLIDS